MRTFLSRQFADQRLQFEPPADSFVCFYVVFISEAAMLTVRLSALRFYLHKASFRVSSQLNIENVLIHSVKSPFHILFLHFQSVFSFFCFVSFRFFPFSLFFLFLPHPSHSSPSPPFLFNLSTSLVFFVFLLHPSFTPPHLSASSSSLLVKVLISGWSPPNTLLVVSSQRVEP